MTTPDESTTETEWGVLWDGPDGENYDLYLASAPGAPPRRLTTAPEKDVSPAWSPGGRVVAFLRGVTPDSARLMTIDLESGKESELMRLRCWYWLRLRCAFILQMKQCCVI